MKDGVYRILTLISSLSSLSKKELSLKVVFTSFNEVFEVYLFNSSLKYESVIDLYFEFIQHFNDASHYNKC